MSKNTHSAHQLDVRNSSNYCMTTMKRKQTEQQKNAHGMEWFVRVFQTYYSVKGIDERNTRLFDRWARVGFSAKCRMRLYGTATSQQKKPDSTAAHRRGETHMLRIYSLNLFWFFSSLMLCFFFHRFQCTRNYCIEYQN